jgi:hypothetical protein
MSNGSASVANIKRDHFNMFAWILWMLSNLHFPLSIMDDRLEPLTNFADKVRRKNPSHRCTSFCLCDTVDDGG